ncbi:MAG: Gfo/Idh/MocA family protein [Acutalibacteraceae bacterium]
MKQIRVAILGQGRSGRDIHGLHLKKDTERFKVAAVVEPFDVRRERAASEYPGCDTYADYRALLERKDIDLVVNATPSHLHFPITKEFLSAGFNVLTEKPFVPTVAECDELTALAKEKGVHMLVFQQSRFANYFQKVKEIIAGGNLGRIAHISIQFNGFARRWDWQCCLDFNGGNLANTGPHPLDQALNLMDNTARCPTSSAIWTV